MAALRDLTSVANATLEAAEDIPVPCYPDQEPETDWMAMKLEAVEDFLREQEVYSPSIRRTQPNPEPATATSTAKGKERAQSPAVKTESAAACDPTTTPAVPALPTDHAPFVNLAARAETLHLSPHTSSIEYLDSRHPDATDGDDSTNDEPSASKRPRLVSPTPSPPAPSPDYLALTPSEIDRLLHTPGRSDTGSSILPIISAESPTTSSASSPPSYPSMLLPRSRRPRPVSTCTAPSSPTSTGDSRSSIKNKTREKKW
ncbi:hypothetical protein PCANC_19573 [Puccinia coronata f. sp. avenae]|uniref:Uncharacterized protein n=1 Tax=Puccinia coronata f. sp. avenae TaxID=200324 RepID=A0A2N5U4N3_9BASI|nr:hypothetical protein PCANC_19573 [Puccinia coronata f. sp. avenae]